MRAPLSARRTSTAQHFALLDRDDGADRNFGEKFSGSVAGQSDAAMGGGIIRHHAFVHSKIKTAQPHKIRHVHFVNCGAMDPVFVSNNEIAGVGGISTAAG